jgi:hypothetical protein
MSKEKVTPESLRAAAKKARARSEQSDDKPADQRLSGTQESGHGHYESDWSFYTREGREKLGVAFDTAVKGLNFLRRAYETSAYVWQNYAGPVAKVLNPPLKFAGRQYGKLWNRFSYTKDENGERNVFSPKRAAAVAVCSVAAAAFTVNNWFFIPAAKDMAMDTYLYTTQKQMEIYLNSPTLLETGVYEVSGCTNYPCKDEDSIYFHIRDNVWKDLEYLINFGHFQYPEDVAGVMTGEANKCTIEFAGSTWKAGQRAADLRAKLLDAECTPVSVGQIKDLSSSMNLDEQVAPG